MVEIANRDEFEAWLADKPAELVVAMAVRAALRVLPLLDLATDHPNFDENVVLPVFRGTAAPSTTQ